VLRFKLDRVVDVAYVQVSDGPAQYARALDEQRILDYDEQGEGEVVGIEFLDVSHGVELRGLPYRNELARYFGDYRIPPFADHTVRQAARVPTLDP
jgi:uncharacterized protein YuzE